MSINEKVSYLKGLIDGLNVDKETENGKIFAAIVDVLDEIAMNFEDLEDYAGELTEQVNAIDEDLGALEDELFSDEDECGCGCGHDHDHDFDDVDFWEVDCPECGEEFRVDEDTLLKNQIECPHCGNEVVFEFDSDDFAEETDEK